MRFEFFGARAGKPANRKQRRHLAKHRSGAALVFEPLEPRVLLSADPLTVALSGDMAHPMAHDVIIEQVTQRLSESDHTTVQMVQVVDQAGATPQILARAPLTDVSAIDISSVAGGASLTVDTASFAGDAPPPITFAGGAGVNTLTISGDGATKFDITGANAGAVSGAATVAFTGVANLTGGNGATEFVVEPGASLSGTLDGGPGVDGTLMFNNYTATNAVFTASGAHSGAVSLDRSVFAYADLSPIVYSGSAANVVITATGEIALADAGSPGQIQASSLDQSMESLTFSVPTQSLTVNLTSGSGSLAISNLRLDGASLTATGTGADSITIGAGDTVSTRVASSDAIGAPTTGNSGNLTLTAVSVTVEAGASVLANANGGFQAGAISIQATSTGTGADATAMVEGATIVGGSVAIDANASANQTITQTGAATLQLSASALAEVDGASDIDATTGSIDIGATVSVGGKITVDAAPGGSLSSDAAVAVSDVSAAANALVDDTTVLDAANAVSVHSSNTTTVETIADGAPAGVGIAGFSAIGGVVAVSEIDTSSSAILGGVSGSPASSNPPAVGDATVTANQVSLTADSETATTTTATSTQGGATANGSVGQAVLGGGADTPDGAVTAAAAIAGAKVTDAATAEMGAAEVTAPDGLDVTAAATRQVATTADASPVHGAGVGVAVAMNQIDAATTAELAGATSIDGAVNVVVGQLRGPDIFGAAAVSGAGGTAPGVAGALAINGVSDISFGGLAADADVTMPSGGLTVGVDQVGDAATEALAFLSDDSTTTGVGASVAVAPVTFSAEAGAQADATLNVGTQGGPETDASFTVEATRAIVTLADGGVAGGGGVAAALALTVAEDSASAELDSGASATVQGNLSLSARQTSDVHTTSEAEAGATASVVAFGIVLDQTQATSSAEVQASGAVTLTASGATSSTTLATAAPGGVAVNGASAPTIIAAELNYLGDSSGLFSPPSGAAAPVVSPIMPGGVSVQPFGGGAGPTVPSGPNGAMLPAAADADGAFGVAGALALGVAIGRVSATVEPAAGMPETVTGSRISLNAYGETAATTRANASGVASTGVGAALALQLSQAVVLAQDNAPIVAPIVSLTASGPQGDTRTPAPAGLFDVQALSGAGAIGVGVAGALAIAADSVNVQALLDSAATATGSVTLAASGKSQSAVDASATGGAGKVGVGASAAVDVSDVHVAASIGVGGSVSGDPSLTIGASGGQTATTTAEGGAEGGVATGAALALAVVTDEISAGVAVGATANVSQANIDASGGGAAKTTATGGADANVTAIGPSLGLGILIDNVTASIDGDLNASGAVTLTAAGANSETTTAQAGERGASSAGASIVALLAAELGFLNDPGGVAVPALNTGAGALGVAAALALGVDAGTIEAEVGGQADAGGALTIMATGDSSANSVASGAAVNSGQRGEGIAAAAAITVATPSVRARIDGSATGAGVTLTAGPATSNGDTFGATATSGVGAGATGVAGAFALLVAAPTTEAAVGAGGVVNAAGDALALTATGQSTETATAAAANLGAGKFGLGASAAIDVAADDTHARLEQGATVTDVDDLTLDATGGYNPSAVALAGSQSGGLSGAIAVNVAPQDTEAEIDPGAALSLTGNLQLTATQTQSSASLALGGLTGQKGEFGAAIAVNAPLPTTDAALDRGAAGGGGIDAEAMSSDTATSDAIAAAGGTDSPNAADKDFAGWLAAAGADGSVTLPAFPSIATSLSKAGSKLGLPLPDIGGAAALAVGAADSNTNAAIAAGAPVTAAGAVTVLAEGSSQAGATADASAVDDDVAAGLGFAVNYDSQNIDASVGGGTTLQAAALTVEAAVPSREAQTAAVRAMAGAGADAGIAGAIALNQVDNSTDAEIDGTSSVVAPDWIIVNAHGNTSSTATAGYAASGDIAGSGVALAGNLDVDVTDATVGAGARLDSPGAIDIAATGAETVDTLAAGAADGGLGAVPASLTADVLLANTSASIGDGAQIDTATPGAPATQIISVTSSDTTALTAAAGSLGIAGLAGTGAAGQFSDIVKQTTAEIDGVVDSAGDVIVQATSSETGLTAADAGALSAVVSVAGGAGVQLGDLLTQAEIGGDASVHAVRDVVVTALDTTQMDTIEGAANASFDASAGAGIGAIGLQKTTAAIVANGAIVDADGEGAGTSAPTGFNITFAPETTSQGVVAKPFLPSTLTDIFGILLNNPIHNLLSPVGSIPSDSFSSQERIATPVDATIHGLAVTALSHDDLAIETAGLGASGLAALELSASGIAAQSTTEAEIGAGAKINQRGYTPSATQSVLVDAEGDSQAMAIAGALPIGGVAAVGPAASLIAMDPVTEAFIGAGASVTSNNDLTVEAHNQTDLLTDTTGVSASNIGVSGSAGATVLGGHTYAYIDANADVVAAGSVQVYALDASTLQNVAGALSGSGLIGAGGSAAINIVGKDTEAWIGAGAHVTALNDTPDFVLAINPDPASIISILPAEGVSVLADSSELVMNLVANGAASDGAAFVGGGAGVIMGNVTAAFIADDAVVTAGQFDSHGNPVAGSNPAEVAVGALDQANTWDGVASLVDATVALSGAVDAGVIRNQTVASVDQGAIVDATGDIDVSARSSETVNSFVGGLGGSDGGVALEVSASVYSIGAVVPGDLLDPLASVSGPGSLESYLDGLLQGMVGAANNGIVGVLNRYAGAVGGEQAAATQLAALTPANPVTGAFTATSAGKAGTTATVTGATLSAHGAVEVTAADAVAPNLDTSFTFALSFDDGVSLALDGGLLAGRANATASVDGGSRVDAAGDIDVLADASTTQNVNSTFAFNNSTGNASALVDGSTLISGGAMNVESNMVGSNKYSGILPGISGLKARTSENKEANTSIASISGNSDVAAAGALTVNAATSSTNKVIADGATLFGDGFDGVFTLGVALAWNNIGDTTTATITGSLAQAQSVAVKADATTNDTSVALGVADGSNDPVAIGGSAARNILADTVGATIEGSTVVAPGGVDVDADDTMTLLAISGGAVARSSFGITGAVSVNTTTDTVTAEIGSSTIEVAGSAGIQIVADGNASMSALSAAAGQSKNVIGASLPVDTLDMDIQADANASTLTTAGDVLVQATGEGEIKALAGAVAVATSEVGVGAAIAVSNAGETVSASINSSDVTAGGNVTVAADSTPEIEALALGLAYAPTVGVGGSVATDNINDVVKAAINGAPDAPSAITAGGDIEVGLNDAPTIKTLTGAAAVSSGEVGLAGSVSIDNIGDADTMTVDNASLRAPTGSIVLQGELQPNILAIAIAGAADTGFTAAGAIATNNVKSTLDETVGQTTAVLSALTVSVTGADNSTITAVTAGLDGSSTATVAGSVSVNNISGGMTVELAHGGVIAATTATVGATDGATIETLAGAVNGAGTYSGGASVATNSISNATTAEDVGGQINARTVNVTAVGKGKIEALAAMGGGAGTVATDAAVTTNTIDAGVLAAVLSGATIDVGQRGTLTVAATSDNTIKSLAGALSGAGTVDVQGAVAYNNIATRNTTPDGANAEVENSTVIGGAATVKAENDDQITSAAVGAGGAGTVALGASVAYNTATAIAKAEVKDDTIELTGSLAVTASNDSGIGSGAGGVEGAGTVAGGAAVAINHIVDDVDAEISGGAVAAHDAVGVEADDNSSIEALSAIGTGAGTVALDASVSINTIGGTILAAMTDGASVNANGAASVKVDSDSTIKSLSGAVSGAGIVGGGAAISLNRIGDTSDESGPNVVGTIEKALNHPKSDPAATPPAASTTATIDDGSTVHAGSVSVDAKFGGEVKTAAIGGAAAGTVALAGAVTDNLIGDQVTASILGKTTTVQAVHDIDLSATNDSTIESLAGALAGAGIASGGAAVAVDKLTGSADAIVDGAKVMSTAGAISITGADSGNITSIAIAGAISATVSLSAAVTVNDLGNTIEAEAENGASLTAPGNITLEATDGGTIESNADDVDGALAALSGAVATNDIADQISARVDYATVTSSQGEVELNATDNASVETLSAAITGGFVAINGTVSSNEIGNTVKAVINDSAVSGVLGVFVQAVGTGGIKSAAANLAAGAAGIGGAAAYNQIENTVAAAIEGGATVSANFGNVMVQSDEQAAVQTLAAGGAFGVAGIGGSVSVSIIANNVYSDVSKSTVSAFGNLGVIADDDDSIRAWGGEIAGGVVGAGASVSVLTLESSTQAYIDASTVSALGDVPAILAIGINLSTGAATAGDARGVVVDARDLENANVKSLTIAGGLVAIPANVADIHSATTTKAYISGSQVNSAATPGAGVFVHATQATTLDGTLGVGGIGFAAIGADVQIATIDNVTDAYIADDVGNGAPAPSSVYADDILVSTATYEKASATTIGVTIGVVAIGGTVAYDSIQSSSNAFVRNSLLDARNGQAAISVVALDNANIATDDKNVSAGLVGAGAAVDVSTIDDTTQAQLIGATLNANGAIEVEANSNGAINDGASGAGAGLVGIAATVLIDHINSLTEADTQSDGSIGTEINQDPTFAGSSNDAGGNTQSVSIIAAGYASIDGSAGVIAGGLVGGGAAIHVGGIEDQVDATVGDGTTITAAGDIAVTANDTRNLESDAFAGSAGLVALGGAFSILSIGGAFDPATLAAINANQSGNSSQLASEPNSYIDQIKPGSMIHASDSPVAANWLKHDDPVLPKVANPLTNSTAASGIFATVGSSADGAAPKLTAGGNITVAATNTYSVNASAGAMVGGLVSLGIGVAYTDITDTVSAETGDGAKLSARGVIRVAAHDTTSNPTQVSATDGQGGVVSVGGALAHTILNLNVDATMRPSTTVESAGGVVVAANQSANLKTNGDNAQVGVLAAGVVKAYTDISGSVSAAVGNGVVIGATSSVGSLTVTVSSDDAGSTHTKADAYGIAAGDGSSASADIDPSLSAVFGDGAEAFVSGDVLIETSSSGASSAEADGTQVGAGAIGVSDADVKFAPSAVAVVGDNALIEAGGDLTIEATDAATGATTATAQSSGGGLISGVGASAEATDDGSAEAQVQSDAGIDAGGTVRIFSTAIDNAAANVNTESLGFVAVGGQSATATADGKSTAELDSDTTVDAGALEVDAAGGAEANALSNAAAGGVASGLGSNVSADASPNVTAEILDHVRVNVTGNLDVIAVVMGGADGRANGVDGALFGEVGESNADVSGAPSVDAAVGAGSMVKADGNVTVEAASPDSASVSNGSFNAATGVDVSNNSIQFNAPTFAQTGDQVAYETNGGVAIGGLENGRTYNVIRDSATAISLGAQFTGAQVDFATGTIQFAQPDRFQTGDRVVYNSNGGPAIGGLVNGAIYYVRVINSTTIKLTHSLAEAEEAGETFNPMLIGANGVITLNGNGFSNSEAVTYRSTGAPVAGLANGDVYYVIRLNANQFELAALPGGPALALSEGFATGMQTLGYEGVAIDGLGVSGPQTLTFVLTSTGAGKQRFVGIGGAAALLPMLASPPSYQAHANGSGGGAFVGVQGMTSTITLSGSTTAYIGAGAQLTAADDVLVEASSWRDTGVVANSGAYGTGAAPGAYATTNDTEKTTAEVASNATITSGHDASFVATGEIAASGQASSSGGGGVAIGQSNVTIQLNPITTAELGDNVGLQAKNDLTVSAVETVSGVISDAASDGGLGAGSHADSYFNVGWPAPMPVTVQFGQNDNLSAGKDATISGSYALPEVVIRTSSSAAGLGARPTTNAFINAFVPVLVNLATGDKVDAGDAVNLEATYGAVGLESYPDTEKTGIGPQDPEAQVLADLGASISAPQGVSIVTHDLTVEAEDGKPFVRAEATEGQSPQTSNDLAVVELNRTIAFDAAVTLTSGPAPDLVVDRLGDVVDHTGVDYSIHSGTITVDAIDNADPGTVSFVTDAASANSFPPLFFPTDSTISGVHAHFTFVDAYASVTLQNWSSMNMTVGAIDLVLQTPSAAITIDVDDASQFRFAVSNVFDPTTIAIGDYNPASVGNLTLAGEIADPIGAITLTALGGNILAKGAGLAQGASVKLIAGGNIGSTSTLLPVEVVESPQAAIGLSAAAGGNLDLSVRARLRDLSVTTFSPQLGSLVAGGAIVLELQSAVSDGVVQGPAYGVSVTQTLPDIGGLSQTVTVENAWPHDGGSQPMLPPGIFAVGSKPINATYNIGLLQAGGSITVTDPGRATVGVTAKTATTGSKGAVSVTASGAISLTQTVGDLRVGTIDSTGAAVSLTALNGSILGPSTGSSTPTPSVEGAGITLAADKGAIGTVDDALDIELEGATGGLTAVAEQGIDILDVSGPLELNSVDAGGAITLGTANGGMKVANGATSPEVVGQTIALTAKGGGIATAANPLKVHNTQANGLTVNASETAYVTEVRDALLMEAGLDWSFGDGGAAAGLVNWGTQL